MLQVTTNTLVGGPSNTMQTVITRLPQPTPTSQTVPLIIPRGSGPSTHTVPLGMPRGSGPSTYTAPPITHGGSASSTHTVPFTTLGGSGPSATLPPVMHMHYVPANPTTIAAPSHINLGSKIPFMACLNLPDLAWLTNDPIHHQTFWPPMPTKLPLGIPKFEGKERECPQNPIMMFHIWCSSNNIIDDSIKLRLFQHALTNVAAK